YNASCPRAALDGDLPVPASWIVQPGRFGGATWDFTTTNPNGSSTPVPCPDTEDVPPGTPDRDPEIAPRTDGPDHPNCPDRQASPAWTGLGFTPGAGWQVNEPLGIGFAPQ